MCVDKLIYACIVHAGLTSWQRCGIVQIISDCHRDEEDKYPVCRRSESPCFGARGRADLVKYTLEQPPERKMLLGLCRVRPLPRRGVMALHEAVSVRRRRTRGGTA